jgi:hypothetical protein
MPLKRKKTPQGAFETANGIIYLFYIWTRPRAFLARSGANLSMVCGVKKSGKKEKQKNIFLCFFFFVFYICLFILFSRHFWRGGVAIFGEGVYKKLS